jgi:SLOG-like protein
MSVTRLDVSLEQYEIGLSGAIPNRDEWSEPAMDRGILEFVSLFTGIVLKYGGRIVHGCHPAFTPVILRQARQQASSRLRPPVTLIMSELWAQDLTSEQIESMTDIAEFVVTKKFGEKGPEDADTRNRSLSAMRRVLIDAQNVTVAVGGMMHSGDGIVPGVAEEIALAAQKGIPRFLVGGLGGLTKKIAGELAPSKLNNSLSYEANMTLFGTPDVGACVNVLFEHLAGSEPLAKSALQPIKWNPSLHAIIDHRDGTVESEATGYILRAVAV